MLLLRGKLNANELATTNKGLDGNGLYDFYPFANTQEIEGHLHAEEEFHKAGQLTSTQNVLPS